MDPVRIGVVGCGVIGARHQEAIVRSEVAELAAVADLIEANRARSVEKFHPARAYATGDDLLDDPAVEAVVLALPTCGRTELALKALARGKHVLTEKPVAMNADEVRRIIAARGDRVVACCSSRMRFAEHAQAARALVDSGALGELRVLACRHLMSCGPKPDAPRPAWRLIRAQNGGGILVNWGVYDLDYLLGLAGWTLRPRTVLAQAWPIPEPFRSHVAAGSDAETYYTAMVRCDGGAVLLMERGEYMPAPAETAWRIVGERGSLCLPMVPDKDSRLLYTAASESGGAETTVLWQGDEGWGVTHAGPVTDFASAIRTGRPPMTTLENALVVQQICDAVYESAANRRVVQIED